MASAKNYKTLYNNNTKQLAEKDRLIVLLQQQVMKLDSQRQVQLNVISDQQAQLKDQEQEIRDQRMIIDQQHLTITGQAEKLSLQQSVIQEQNDLISSQQQQITKCHKDLLRLDNLCFEMATLKKWVYGIKSEKRYLPSLSGRAVAGDQLLLAMEVDTWGVCDITDRRKVPEHMRIIKSTTPKKAGGRNDFPPGLEEEITVFDATDKPANARCVGHVDQKQLACDPMRWYIKVTRRLIYLAPADEDNLNYKQFIAPLPPHPIDKCKMDISILVMLTIEKFLYHMPVWRQQQRLRHYGIDLPYSTLCWLVNRTCGALEPLWHLLLKEITGSRLIHVDETRYRVLDNAKKKGKKSHIGWMWAAMNPMQRIVCFVYQKGRSKKDISSVLHAYKGYLMTDGYGVYTKYGKQPGVTHQQCLSHTRRYFMYALENDNARATYALDHFLRPLYDIEAECKILNLNFDSITEKRQAESLPILQAFRQWLVNTLPLLTPKTPIYKAVYYALNNYNGITHYIDDGMLSIDNNQLEGQIRAIALGRNSHLFAGSHRGGELAAIIYSFMATCKLHKLDPAKWLSDVLHRLPVQAEDKLIELLPQFWKPIADIKAHTA